MGRNFLKVSGHTTSDVQSAAESPVEASSCEDSSSQCTLVDSSKYDQKPFVAKTTFPVPGLQPAVARGESHGARPLINQGLLLTFLNSVCRHSWIINWSGRSLLRLALETR